LAIAAKAASDRPPRRRLADSKTHKRLGYDPITLDEGLRNTTEWLRNIGKIS
jgi:nucleoside-diphosphate-sugar epimerase